MKKKPREDGVLIRGKKVVNRRKSQVTPASEQNSEGVAWKMRTNSKTFSQQRDCCAAWANEEKSTGEKKS